MIAKSSSGHLFGRMIMSLSKQLPSTPFTGQHDPDIEAIVLSLLIGAVCLVEAVGNEVFSTCAEYPASPTLASLNPQDVAAAGAYWKAKSGRLPSNSIDKWELLAKKLGKKLRRTEVALIEMGLLIQLRNRCIHAKPSHWPTQDEDDKALEAKLRGKFTLNKYDGNTLFFPNEVLSVGCAEWAVETACNFIAHAATTIGITPKYGIDQA